jgi:4-carboxymuconolactone decarboxylase
MARIAGLTERDAAPEDQIALAYTRSGMAGLAEGRALDNVIEPLELYALVPGLLKGLSELEGATRQMHALDVHLRDLAELKAATMTGCEYCIDLGSLLARRSGLTDAQLLALPAYRTSPLFSELEKLVLDYAVGMCRTPVDVSDELFEALRQQLSPEQMVELTHIVAVENMRGRFNLALGVGAAGFSEGTVCAVPALA